MKIDTSKVLEVLSEVKKELDLENGVDSMVNSFQSLSKAYYESLGGHDKNEDKDFNLKNRGKQDVKKETELSLGESALPKSTGNSQPETVFGFGENVPTPSVNTVNLPYVGSLTGLNNIPSQENNINKSLETLLKQHNFKEFSGTTTDGVYISLSLED